MSIVVEWQFRTELQQHMFFFRLRRGHITFVLLRGWDVPGCPLGLGRRLCWSCLCLSRLLGLRSGLSPNCITHEFLLLRSRLGCFFFFFIHCCICMRFSIHYPLPLGSFLHFTLGWLFQVQLLGNS